MSVTKRLAVPFSFFLIGVFMLQISMNTLIYVRFKSEQTYISNALCVNRFDAKSTCKGACYLKSQLKKTDTKSASFQGYLKYKTDLFFVSDACMKPMQEIFFPRMYAAYILLPFKQPLIDFFHPPA